MFQQVEVKDLQVNQLYKIIANNYVFKGIFKGFRYVDEIKLFDGLHPDLSLEFERVHNITIGLHFNRTNIIYTCPLYQFVSKNPKGNMETRAVNKIIRQLVGDYFEW